MKARIPLLLALLALALPTLSHPQPYVSNKQAQPVPAPVPTGKWGTPVQHDVNVGPGFLHVPSAGPNGRLFKTLHLALIPQPASLEGLVIGWDSQNQNGSGGGWYQRWTVLDPSTDPPTVLWNDELFIPASGAGDLFCSGHAWTADGRLFVAGGTTQYGSPFGGARLALLFDPGAADALNPYGKWFQLPDMAKNRWYPTVTLLGNDQIVVTGGSHLAGAENTYEVFDLATLSWQVDPGTGNPWFPGPLNGASPLFGNYRRMHTLSDGFLFMSSPQTTAAKVDHPNAPGSWTIMAASSVTRHDGASLFFPRNTGREDEVWIVGGSQGAGHASVHKTVESIFPKQTGATWVSEPSMKRNRVHLNALALPDKTVLAIAGNDVNGAGANVFWKDAEWFSGGSWNQLAAGASVRDYHSTAALLPSGKVLSAGGDNRDWDYQLFSPPYFDLQRPRPTNVALSGSTLGYQANGAGPYTATFNALPAGTSVRRVVLLAPTSTTHHSDMGARFVDLPIVSKTASNVVFQPPFNSCGAPNPTHSCATRGYHMLFIVTNKGVPSQAKFVRLQ